MFAYLAANFGTILAGALLLALVVGAVAVLRRDRARGENSCGHGCDHCAMHDQCHESARKVKQ